MWAALDNLAVIVTSVPVIVAFRFSVGISATPEHTPTRQPLMLVLGWIGVWERFGCSAALVSRGGSRSKPGEAIEITGQWPMTHRLVEDATSGRW